MYAIVLNYSLYCKWFTMCMLSGLFRRIEGLEYVFVPEGDGLAPGAERRVVEFQNFDEHLHDYVFQLLEKK